MQTKQKSSVDTLQNRLAVYNSPMMVLMGIALVLLCANIHLPLWAEKIVNFLAPASLGVYLLHLHLMVLKYFLQDRFIPFVEFPAWSMLPIVLGLTLAIYLVCSCIDLMRYHLFCVLRVKEQLRKLEEKLLPNQVEYM